jgi:hypothetical protein
MISSRGFFCALLGYALILSLGSIVVCLDLTRRIGHRRRASGIAAGYFLFTAAKMIAIRAVAA